MGRVVIAGSIAVALGLVTFGLVAAALRPRPQPPRLISMAEAAQAMLRDGGAMQVHAQVMLDEARRTGDQDLAAHGEHWQRDGLELVQRGQWMAMNPIAPGSLVASPSQLSQEGSWGELTRTAQAMLHDPSRARGVDLEALRWNGVAMQAEARNMAEHGRLMAEEADVMIAQHGLQGEAAATLRQAAETMREVSGYLEQNGQAMVDYAERLRRSLGYAGA